MAYGDFADLKAKAARAAQFRPSNTDDDTRAGEAVNEAYLYVCSQSYEWDFLQEEGSFTLTASTSDYSYDTIGTAMSLSYPIEEIYSIVNDTESYEPLRGMSWMALEQWANSTEDSDPEATPYAWSQWNRQVKFYPTPDAADSMRALVKLTASVMTNDSDTPLIPLNFRSPVIVPYAAALLLEQEGGGEATNDYHNRINRHEMAFRELVASHGSGRRASFQVQTPTFGSDLPGSTSGFGWLGSG